MLWVGWFGFNAGSELASDGIAASAFAATHFAAAAGGAGLGRHGMDHSRQAERAGRLLRRGGRPGVHHAGLRLSCSRMPALIMGLAAGVVCFLACTTLKTKFGYDDSLDAFGVHGVGGTLGAILTGVFATRAVTDPAVSGGKPLGLIEGGSAAHRPTRRGRASPGCWPSSARSSSSRCSTPTMGLRVTQQEEIQGLDLSQHGEEGYIFMLIERAQLD